MPEQVLTPEEKIFCEMLHDKVEFFEFFWSEPDRPWKSRKYQTKLLLDEKDRIVCDSARSVGKTVSLECDITYTAIVEHLIKDFREEGLIGAPNDVHLQPTLDRIENKILGDSFLNLFAKKPKKAPTYIWDFTTGYKLYARIEGASSGRNFLNLHIDKAWIDEGQLISKRAARQLLPGLNEGSTLKVFGVPNGVRGTYFWQIAEDDAPNVEGKRQFSHHNISRMDSPDFTEKMRQEAIKLYNGEQSQDYINLVLGEWGEAQYGAFDPEQYIERINFKLDYNPRTITPTDLAKSFDEILYLPTDTKGDIFIGADIGYDPDPTVMFFADITENKKTIFHKIILKKIKYPDQARIFDYCIQFFSKFKKCGIDNQGIGVSLIHSLHDTTLFPNTNYQNTVIPVKFGGSIEIGKDENGKPVKQKILFYTHTLLQQLLADPRLEIPDDQEMLNEFQAHTMKKNASGDYLFRGIDHHIAAVRCLAFILEEIKKTTTHKKYYFGTVDF